MAEKRTGKERRSKGDRRKGASSPYNGPERRGVREQRTGKDRRSEQ